MAKKAMISLTCIGASSKVNCRSTRNNKICYCCKKFGLTINIKKTEVLYQQRQGSDPFDPEILIDGKPIQSVKKFAYLGSTVTSTNKLDTEIANRIQPSSKAYGSLHKRVWSQRDIHVKTACKAYRAMVLTALLYSAETYTLYRRHTKKLNIIQQ